MMREILFRGKRKDNGEWIVGHLLEYEDGRARITESHTDIFCYEKDRSIIQTVAHEVVPETIGQYTGLKDKNGKKIFEEDVVRLHSILFVVKWRKSEFYLGHIEGQPWSFPYIVSHAEDCEVIGNIHDNPELLEVKHESD